MISEMRLCKGVYKMRSENSLTIHRQYESVTTDGCKKQAQTEVSGVLTLKVRGLCRVSPVDLPYCLH